MESNVSLTIIKLQENSNTIQKKKKRKEFCIYWKKNEKMLLWIKSNIQLIY